MSQKTKYLCRFTRELDEKLIELVSENEVLYDHKHKYYKDLSMRDDVWLAISSIVGKSGKYTTLPAYLGLVSFPDQLFRRWYNSSNCIVCALCMLPR